MMTSRKSMKQWSHSSRPLPFEDQYFITDLVEIRIAQY